MAECLGSWRYICKSISLCQDVEEEEEEEEEERKASSINCRLVSYRGQCSLWMRPFYMFH